MLGRRRRSPAPPRRRPRVRGSSSTRPVMHARDHRGLRRGAAGAPPRHRVGARPRSATAGPSSSSERQRTTTHPRDTVRTISAVSPIPGQPAATARPTSASGVLIEHRQRRDLGAGAGRIAVQLQRRLERGRRKLVDPQRPRQRVRAGGGDRIRGADAAARPAGPRAACRPSSTRAPPRRRSSAAARLGAERRDRAASREHPRADVVDDRRPSSHSSSMRPRGRTRACGSWTGARGGPRAPVPPGPSRAAVVARAGCGWWSRPRSSSRPTGRSRRGSGSRRRSPRAARARR